MYAAAVEDELLEALFERGLVRQPFERVASAAEQTAREALAKEGPAAAVQRAAAMGARATADIARVRLAAGQWDPKAACARGCAHCCSLRVEVTEAEASLIATAIPAGDPRRERIAARAAELAHVSREERLRTRVPCALLGEDRACSVYDVRPLSCRAASSLDADACARGLASGDDSAEIPIEPWSTASMRAAHVGLRRALIVANRPSEVSELHEALARILE